MDKPNKKILISIGIVLAISAITTFSLLLINRESAQQLPAEQESPLEIGDKHAKLGAENEDAGMTDQALSNYEQALEEYKKAGDETKQDAIKIQIEYMKNAQKLEQSIKDGTYKGPEQTGSDPLD